jgi:tetratricopeptide (TPR) repeat protein
MVYVERRLGHWREAEARLSRAIELDPRNSRIWTRTAAYDVFKDLGRFSEAQAALDRALEISPKDQYAILIKVELFGQEGRLDEAAKQLTRLPKDSTDINILLIRAHYALLKRDFEQVILLTHEATKAVTPEQPLTSQEMSAFTFLAYAQLWTGRAEEARATFARIIQATPLTALSSGVAYDTRSLLALAYAGIGDKEKAFEQANQAVADSTKDAINRPIAEAYRATIQARFGELDAAIAAIAHLLEAPGGISPGEIRYSPFYDPLRSDPRFEALVKNPPPVRY